MQHFFVKQKLSLIIILLSLVILIFLPYAFFWHNGEKLGFWPNIISEPDFLNQFKSNELTPSEIAKIPNNYSFQPTSKPNYQYENFNLNFESFLGGDEKEPHRVYFQSGGYFIEFKLVGGNFNHLILSDYESQKNGQIIYNDILPSTDIRYRINSKGLKEELILADKKSPSEFLFELNFDKNNTYYKKMPDGLWHFFGKNSEGEMDLYKFPALYMKDKNGVSSDKVEINIFQKNNKDYISIKADKKWLLQSERVYPVIIDPAIEVIAATTNLFTQYPTYRKVFRVTSGSYAGRIMILYLSTTTAISFRTDDPPYDSWSGATSVNTTALYTTSASGASAIMDNSFNVYVAFCRDDTTDTLASVKLTYSGGSWSAGTEVTIKDGGGGVSRPQTYPSLAADRYNPTGTGDKIWVAWRYYTGTNYSIRTMTTTDGGTTWSNESADLSTAGTNVMTVPHLVKYGEKLAVIYNDQDTGLEWRWREDNDADTVWDGPINTVITASGTIDNQFSVTADNNNYLHLIYFNAGIQYKKGAYSGGTITWDAGETAISATATSMEPNISTDGLNLYAFWSEYIGTSQYQMAYKKGANSGGTITWDGSATIIDSHERCFDIFFAYSSIGTYTNDTTDACDSGTADVYNTNSTKLLSVIDDAVYFGSTEKFDYIYSILSTVGVGASTTIQWQYYTTTWTNFTPTNDATTSAFKGSGRIELWDGIANAPSNWAQYSVNGSSNYYYVKAYVSSKTAYSTAPIGTQLTAVKDNTYASSAINDGLISLMWLEDVPGTTSDNLKFTAYNPSSQYWQWFDDTYDATPTLCFTSNATCTNNENTMAAVGIGKKNALKLRYTIKENGGIQQLDGRKRVQYSTGTDLSPIPQVSANTDDGYESDNVWYSDASFVWCSTEFPEVDYGVRFSSVSIAQGSTIASAVLRVNSKGSQTSSINTLIKGIDEDNTPTWSTPTRPSTRTKTTAQVAWNISDAWTDGSWYDSTDITSIVQEIVDRSGWASTNAMAFVVENNDTGGEYKRDINDFIDSTSLAAKLVVTYYAASSTWYNVGVQSTSWWDTNYLYRRAITIKNVTDDNLTDYSVSYQFGHKALVDAGLSLSSGNDVRIVNDSGTQIDRVLDEDTTSYGWNDTDTKIWFKVASVNAFSSVTYYMYYDYSSATAPTGYADKSDVFALYDDFETGETIGQTPVNWTNDNDTEFTVRSIGSSQRVAKTTYVLWSYDVYHSTLSIGDCEILATIRRTASNGTAANNWAGVLFHRGNNGYYVLARATPATDLFNESWVGQGVGSAITFNQDTDYTMKITALGAKLNAWWGATQFYTDKAISAGTTGSVGFAADNNAVFTTNYSPAIDNIRVRKYTYPEPVVTAADYDDGQEWLYFNGVDTDDSALASNLLSDATAVATHNESGTAASTYDHAANTAAEWEFTLQNFNGTASSPYGFRLFDNKSNYYVYLNDATYSYPAVQTSAYTLTVDAPSNVYMTDWTLGTSGNNATQFPAGSLITMTDYRGTGADWNLNTISTHLFQSVTDSAPATVGDLNATSAVNQRHLVKYTTGGNTFYVLGYYSTSETAIGFIENLNYNDSWFEAITGTPTTVGDTYSKDDFSMDIDSSGNIHVTYLTYSGGTYYIKYIKLTYDPGNYAWDIPASDNTVYSQAFGSLSNPVIKLESGGRIWVVFNNYDTEDYYLFAYYSDNGTSWSSAKTVDTNAAGAYTSSIASFYMGTVSKVAPCEAIAVAYYYGTDTQLNWRYHCTNDAVGTWTGEATIVTGAGAFSSVSLAGEGKISSDDNLFLVYQNSGIYFKRWNGINNGWDATLDKTISNSSNDVDPMVTCYRDGTTRYVWVYFGDYQAANDYQVATQYYDGSAWDSSPTTISPTTSKNRRYPAAVEVNKTPAVVWSEYDNSSAYNLYSYITVDFIENDEISWSTGTISTMYGSQTSSGDGSVSAGAGGALNASVTAVTADADTTSDEGAGRGNYTIRPTLTITGNELNQKLAGTYVGIITLTII